MQDTFIIVWPRFIDKLDKITKMIEDSGLKIEKSIKTTAEEEKIKTLYSEHSDNPFFKRLIEDVVNKEIYIVEVTGEKAVKELNKIARKLSTDLKEMFKEDVIHVPSRYAASIREKGIFANEFKKRLKV